MTTKRPPAPRADCNHTKPSALVADHNHTCNGAHLEDVVDRSRSTTGRGAEERTAHLHKCSDPACRRWFT